MGPYQRAGPRASRGATPSPQQTNIINPLDAGTAENISASPHGHEWTRRLQARRDASNRLPPLVCGCREVWPHHCQRGWPGLTASQLDAAHAAAAHLLEIGCSPLFGLDVIRALRRRDPSLSQHLYALAGGDA
jgi:hypothetical protein